MAHPNVCWPMQILKGESILDKNKCQNISKTFISYLVEPFALVQQVHSIRLSTRAEISRSETVL